MFNEIFLKIIKSDMNFINNDLSRFSILIIILFGIAIFFIRLFFRLILFIFSKFYLKTKLANKKIKKAPNVAIFNKEEQLLRNITKESLNSKKLTFNFIKNQSDNRLIDDIEKLNETEELFNDNARIVGIVKPIGFWTSLVLGDKLTEIFTKAKALSDRSKKGFWVSMLETQSKINIKRTKGNILE